jgi:hypothetical protein
LLAAPAPRSHGQAAPPVEERAPTYFCRAGGRGRRRGLAAELVQRGDAAVDLGDRGARAGDHAHGQQAVVRVEKGDEQIRALPLVLVGHQPLEAGHAAQGRARPAQEGLDALGAAGHDLGVRSENAALERGLVDLSSCGSRCERPTPTSSAPRAAHRAA